jgi:hypothetical protein
MILTMLRLKLTLIEPFYGMLDMMAPRLVVITPQRSKQIMLEMFT